ncbi:DUF167 domain-containing protein [Qipengyuania sp. GH38]|uniref:DUF167 domain-containing protein n=1 Tax=Qipengyuania intermedia TaxID=2867244 RepID=UPI001C87D2B8|nr:DUF167 domain-containing protein [Qipengyuania intermedia]MBX7513916.1 DUF167 domain-containing protein [Qipengyuania intermedia]
MPRPKADFPDSAELQALVADGHLRVRVTPGARSDSIVIDGERVLVKVRAKPTDGDANASVEKLVARALGVPTSLCRIVRGATSREKVLEILRI